MVFLCIFGSSAMLAMETDPPRRNLKKRLFENITNRPSLIEAIKNDKNADAIEIMISKEFALVNEKDKQGLTPLYWAVEKQKPDIVQLLLKNGALTDSLHIIDTHNNTNSKRHRSNNLLNDNKDIGTSIPVFHFAISHGTPEIVQLLIDHYKEKEKSHRQLVETNQSAFDQMQTLVYQLNAHDPFGFTPLHYAAERDNKDIISLLSKNGANSFKKSSTSEWRGIDDSLFPDEWATVNNKKDTAKVLQKKISNPDCETHLHIAAASNNIPRIYTLLTNHPDMAMKKTNEEGNTPLHYAVQFAQENAVQTIVNLVDKKHDIVNIPNLEYDRPLHRCAQIRDPELSTKIADFLIQNGANVNITNTKKQTPLHLVETPECAKLLINKGANVNIEDTGSKTPLHYAAQFDTSGAIVELLLQTNANANAKTITGATPLHIASAYNNKEAVKRLLQVKDIDLDATHNKDLTTPLHYAINREFTEIATLLIESGADCNIKEYDQFTPLHYAANTNNLEIAIKLLAHNATVNTQDCYGLTPLHYAVKQENKDMINLLLMHKANTTVQTNDNYRPIDFTENEEIRALLDPTLSNQEKPV